MANYSLNVEISTHEAKILEVSKGRGDQYTVHAAGKVHFDPDGKSKLLDSLKHCISSKGSQDKCIATSVWSPTVIVRRIHMPPMTQAELKSAIRFEFEKHIPFSPDDCFIDYYIVKKMAMNERMEIMLVSAKKEMVELRRRLMAEAGWSPNFIDIHPFALGNAFQSLTGKGKQKAAALIHIEEVSKYSLRGSNFVNILKESQPIVVRDLGEYASGGGNEIPEDSLERVSEAIRQSFEFYENSADEAIEDVYISGQGANSKQLVQHLEKTLEVKINTWSFLDRLEFGIPALRDNYRKNEQDYLVLMGLAIRGL